MRGFATIALHQPKDRGNIGSVLRAAHCYGAAQVVIGGSRGHKTYRDGVRHAANTPCFERHTPVIIAPDCLAYNPFGTQVVAVDLVEGATPLPEFQHPRQAVYVFGPEDGTLGKSILDRAHHVVMVPTRSCMNLAATVNVILYDRMMKGGDFSPAYEGMSRKAIAAFYDRRGTPPKLAAEG